MVVGNGYGYGYGEEGGGPIIEQTSSSESHYELMALARLVAAGLEIGRASCRERVSLNV